MIGSRLDADASAQMCRLALAGRLVALLDATPAELARLRVFKVRKLLALLCWLRVECVVLVRHVRGLTQPARWLLWLHTLALFPSMAMSCWQAAADAVTWDNGWACSFTTAGRPEGQLLSTVFSVTGPVQTHPSSWHAGEAPPGKHQAGGAQRAQRHLSGHVQKGERPHGLHWHEGASARAYPRAQHCRGLVPSTCCRGAALLAGQAAAGLCALWTSSLPPAWPAQC